MCFVNIFFRKGEKKVYSRRGFRQGRSGYSKHNSFFFRLRHVEEISKGDFND